MMGSLPLAGFSAALLSFASRGAALSASAPPSPPVFVVTHAAGRMGKLLALQIKEDAEIQGRDAPRIRAVVRSEEEARSVRCDLGGMRMSGGRAEPVPLDWLDVVVVEGVREGAGGGPSRELRDAFDGADYAVLCDAAHNEIVWSAADGGGGDEEVCSVAVPAVESRDLSERLLAEIDAAAASPTLRHVLLRSSMGLAAGADSRAGAAMGGAVALDGPCRAEEALRRSRLDHTILRLGALTDDPGMVPLMFGRDDSILLKRIDTATASVRPPIMSRADAARVSTFLLKETDALKGMTIDCSWHPKFGRNSVGTEEAIQAASRQDLKRDILKRCSPVNI